MIKIPRIFNNNIQSFGLGEDLPEDILLNPIQMENIYENGVVTKVKVTISINPENSALIRAVLLDTEDDYPSNVWYDENDRLIEGFPVTVQSLYRYFTSNGVVSGEVSARYGNGEHFSITIDQIGSTRIGIKSMYSTTIYGEDNYVIGREIIIEANSAIKKIWNSDGIDETNLWEIYDGNLAARAFTENCDYYVCVADDETESYYINIGIEDIGTQISQGGEIEVWTVDQVDPDTGKIYAVAVALIVNSASGANILTINNDETLRPDENWTIMGNSAEKIFYTNESKRLSVILDDMSLIEVAFDITSVESNEQGKKFLDKEGLIEYTSKMKGLIPSVLYSETEPVGNNNILWIEPNDVQGGEAFAEPMKIYGDTLPVGTMVPFGGEVVPSNWLVCNGQRVSKEEYPELFKTLGDLYGESDETTFVLPDRRGKVSVGLDSDDPNFDSIGQTGGAKEVTLSASQLPSHTHSGTTKSHDGHTHNTWNTFGISHSTGAYTSTVTGVSTEGRGNPTASGGAHSHTFTTNATGDNEAHSNLQPYIVDKWIIKAKQSIGATGVITHTLFDPNDNAVPNADTVKKYIDMKDASNVYSTEEMICGTWINGKPIYRKVINVGTAPQGSTKQIDGVVSYMDTLVSLKGTAYNAGFNQTYNIPNAHTEIDKYYINSLLAGNNLQIRVGSGFSDGLTKVYIILEYTKTTD